MERGFNSVAVAASVMSMGLGVMYWAARVGFETPLAPIIASVGLALLFINVPPLAWRLLGKSESWPRSYSFIWLVTFAALAAVGRVAVEGPSWIPVVTAIAGFIAFGAVASLWVRAVSLKSAFLTVVGSAFFATWAGGVVWGRIYKNPLFLESLMANGIVHHDAVTLAALGNMLRTYHVASMGLDGIPYMAYHWGTPWLFAQLSNLTSQSVLEFYQLGFPLTMIPVFFGGIIAFAAQLSREDVTSRARTWVIFLAATVGVIPLAGMDALGVWTSNLLISESYTVGVPVALMLLATVVLFWRQRGAAILGRDGDVFDFLFLGLVLGGGLVALGYLKISLMILGAGAAGYAALRAGALRRWQLIVLAIWIAGIVVVTYGRVSLVAHREGIAPLDFLQGFVPRAWWPFFILAQLFWSIVYVILRLRQENARTVGDLFTLIASRKILDAEVLAVVAVAGILPGFILHIDGGSAFYFSDIQRWLAVGFLIAGAATLIGRLDWKALSPIAKVGVVFVALPFVVSMARNSVHWTLRMAKSNAELRHSLYPEPERARIPAGVRWLPQLMDPERLRPGLESAPNYNPVQGLLGLSRMPLAQKRRTAVFVSQTEEKYWNILKRPNACGFSGFVVPSLTGISMIDGMPRPDCKLSPYYGLSLFQRRMRPQSDADRSDTALCDRARRWGFADVMELHFDEQGRMTQRTISCKSSA